MAKGRKAPVTLRAVIQRINRKLAADGLVLKAARGRRGGATTCSTRNGTSSRGSTRMSRLMRASSACWRLGRSSCDGHHRPSA